MILSRSQSLEFRAKNGLVVGGLRGVEVSKFISRLKEISTKFSRSEAGNGKTTTHPVSEITEPSATPADLSYLADKDSVTELIPETANPSENPRKPTILRLKQPWKHPRLTLEWLLKGVLVSTSTPLYRRQKFWMSVGAIAVVGGISGAYVGWRTLESRLPNVNELSSFVRDGTITIKAADGRILQQTGPATREKLKIDTIPDQVIKAFIAAEDRRFYQHEGIDYQGIFRAVISNLLARDVVQGGSTITQQLARLVFLNQERTIGRKLREAMMAMKIEEEMPKDEILERYLNLVYLGSGAYGVADAAWVYFSKPVEDLTLSEIATIAGLPPAPSSYSPLVNPQLALKRRNIVLDRMVDADYITEAQAEAAKAQSLALKPSQPKRLYVEAPYFTSYIKKELPKYIPAEALEMGGLIVETSLNPEWQKVAEKVIKDAVELDGSAEGFEQAAIVSIDPNNGEIKAMVGGYDFEDSEFNRVTQAQRQPGSTFKGLVYTAAIAAGFSPYDGYLDASFRVDGYQPRNFTRKYLGWLSMRDALAYSTNIVAVKVLIDVGFDPTIKLAQAMGIKSKLQPTYSLALGSSEVNLLELTNAYATIAAEGKYTPAHGIRRVIDRRGKTIYNMNSQPKRVVDRDTASIITWMLEGVVNYGSGRAAVIDRPVAGKTGTSDEARDLWFIGYIPQLVTGVWLGNDDSYPTWGGSGTAAYTWREFMVKATNGMPVKEFPKLPELEGRKGTIEAKPVTPHSISSGFHDPEDRSVQNPPQDTGNYAQDSGGYYEDSGEYYQDSGGGYY